MSIFNECPTEIVLDILTLVKQTSSTRFFGSCALVCRSWHGAVLPLLYCNVGLSDSNIDTFCDSFNRSYSSLVFSLTFRLLEREYGLYKRESFEQSVGRLATMLSNFNNLSTFSFYANRGSWVTVSHDTLISLVDALPDSCVNLELDTKHCDVIESDAHLCDHIRSRLPRMKHVRICLQFVCSALFGTGPVLLAPKSEEFDPIPIPTMETLVMNCVKGGTSLLPLLCTHWHRGLPPLTATGWHSVTRALERLIDAEYCPPSAKLFVISLSDHDDEDFTVYNTFYRAEMVSQTTLTFPLRMVCRPDLNDGYLLRTQDGQDLLSTLQNLNDYAEGQIWKDTSDGSRLPAAILETKGSLLSLSCVARGLPLMSVEEFRRRYPRKSCTLWVNERKSGMTLLHPDTRRGRDVYLAREPLVEVTPPGFTRVGGVCYDLLYEEGDPSLG